MLRTTEAYLQTNLSLSKCSSTCYRRFWARRSCMGRRTQGLLKINSNFCPPPLMRWYRKHEEARVVGLCIKFKIALGEKHSGVIKMIKATFRQVEVSIVLLHETPRIEKEKVCFLIIFYTSWLLFNTPPWKLSLSLFVNQLLTHLIETASVGGRVTPLRCRFNFVRTFHHYFVLVITVIHFSFSSVQFSVKRKFAASVRRKFRQEEESRQFWTSAAASVNPEIKFWFR